jgi:hypothetical protein
MRPLPAEILHFPLEPGPYRMAMNLTTVPESAWFEFDDRYHAEMAEKRHLLATRHDEVFAALPGSTPACAEALDLIGAALARHHPDWFGPDGGMIRDYPADLDPLDRAGRLVQEDLCLIQDGILTAASLCFPSRWRLADKIGKALADVHGPVPLYADRLARPVDRFMAILKPDRIAMRLNWSVTGDPALFQPGGKFRSNTEVTAANAGDTLFLRAERQTLRRLPASGAVLFGIRVHVYPLRDAVRQAGRAAILASAIRALPPAILRYKSLLPFRDVLLQWLASPYVDGESEIL